MRGGHGAAFVCQSVLRGFVSGVVFGNGTERGPRVSVGGAFLSVHRTGSEQVFLLKESS
ncbi:hypothetical protein C9F78_004105 [Salmonella enterica subsp. enterica serovar 4,[5],12:b:-]|nr:hypothetical protein [Salmonella enterica subsp. enterica serovar 4,[5],12:b:-]